MRRGKKGSHFKISKNAKKKLESFTALLLALCLVLSGIQGVFDFFGAAFLSPQSANAIGDDAIDIIGQTNANGDPDFTSHDPDNGNPANAQGFSAPNYSVVDEVGHRLFVSDPNNSRIMVFDLDVSNHPIDRTADAVLGQDSFTTVDAQNLENGGVFSYLAVDSTGSRLFAYDQNANPSRILVFDISSVITGEPAVNVLGAADFDSASCANPGFCDFISGVSALTYDDGGDRLFVGDGNRVLVFDVAAITNGEDAVNVLGQEDFAGTSCANPGVCDFGSSALAYDEDGDRLFVGDGSFGRVLVFDVAAITNGEDAVNVLNHSDFASTPCDNGTPEHCQFSIGQGLTYDNGGDRLFVGDGNFNRIMVFDVAAITDGEDAVNVLGNDNLEGGSCSPSTMCTVQFIQGLFYEELSDQLIAPDNGQNRVLIFDVVVVTDGENASDLFGQVDGNGDPVYDSTAVNNAPTADGMNHPSSGVVTDSVNHRLFISDSVNNRILVYGLDSSDQLIDHTADNVLGQPDFKRNSPGTSVAEVSEPEGLAASVCC
jgi:hypothetical protein